MANEQKKARELAELLIAFSEGKQFQIKNIFGKWEDYDGNMSIGFIDMNYGKIRIKPETKRVKLTMQDMIDRELSGKTMRLSNGDFIWSWNDEYVRIINAYIDYDYLLESNSTFLDDTPCYKEVVCE